MTYMCTNFDDCSFSRSRDMVGVNQNLNGSRDLTTPLSGRYMLSSCVCLSVRHTPVLYQNSKRRIMQRTLHGSPGILVSDAKNLGEISTGHPNGGTK